MLSKLGNEEGKTLTFGKQNCIHGHVDVICINFHPFVLGICEDVEEREVGLGDEPYTLSTNSVSFNVSTMPNNNRFEF